MSRLDQILNDYHDPDRYFGPPPDEGGKPKIHWAIRKLVRNLEGDYGVGSFYRSIYKNTPCGPSIGFLIDGEWVYCDDLYKYRLVDGFTNTRENKRLRILGSRRFWHDHVVEGVSVSSIVEGSDAEVPGEQIVEMPADGDLAAYFWRTVENVNAEASYLWDRDNSIWLKLTHSYGEEGEAVEDVFYGQWANFDEPKFGDDGEDVPPADIIEKVRAAAEDWAPNSAEGPVDLGYGWELSAYEVYD